MWQIGPLTIDFNPLLDAAAVSPFQAGWMLISNGGWIVLAVIALKYFLHWWPYDHLWHKHVRRWKWITLSIDVPKENIQSPRAVENILAHLAGAHNTPDLVETWITGFAQEWFSLEIASIGGEVRFYIHTTEHMRDLVEASIYAQYPNAEINQVEDYTQNTPNYFPDPKYNLWGTEWKQVNHYAYPIRTFEAFQDETAEEAAFKDPMAALLETMGTLLPGEQLWFQILVTPIDSNSWQGESHRLINKIAGKKDHGADSWWKKILHFPIHLLEHLSGEAYKEENKRDAPLSQVIYLTSGEIEAIKALDEKAAKIGFKTKIRAVYLSPKELWNKARGRYGLIGAIKQVNTENFNSLKPETKIVGTHAHYFFTNWRKNWKRRKIMRAYKKRSVWTGLSPMILNIEEIATLWHFPVAESVKAPLLKKSEIRRGEPPHGLPTGLGHGYGGARRAPAVPRGEPPPTLPKGAPEETEELEQGIPRNLPVG